MSSDMTTGTDRPKLERSYERRFRRYPSLGVLRLDYNYPPVAGDIDSPDSFCYPVFYRAVPGLTFQVCQSGQLTSEIAQELDDAIDYLVKEKKVSAITGDCGFMMWFQKRIATRTLVPVIMSSLTQIPTLVTAFSTGTIIVMTANEDSLKPMRELIQSTCGVDILDTNLHFVGCQDVPHFGEQVAKGLKVDAEKARPGIIDLAREATRQFRDARAILMECTQLPPFSEAVKEVTGLPVFDAITGCDFVMDAFLDNPNFGDENWLLEWDGKQEPYQFGKNLRPSARLRLLTKMSMIIDPTTGKSLLFPPGQALRRMSLAVRDMTVDAENNKNYENLLAIKSAISELEAYFKEREELKSIDSSICSLFSSLTKFPSFAACEEQDKDETADTMESSDVPELQSPSTSTRLYAESSL